MNFKTIFLPKTFVIVLLASFFALAFIVTPYWSVSGSAPKMLFVLMCTIILGAAWAYVSADDLYLKVEAKKWVIIFLPLLTVSILNINALTADIPWKGDEDYHIARALQADALISPVWVMELLVLFVILLCVAWQKPQWSGLAGALCLGIILIQKNPLAASGAGILLRYPYVSYWFIMLAPKIATAISVSPYHEVLFRVSPVVSVVLLVWLFQKDIVNIRLPVRFFWGLCVSTIPLVFYYSSILYLELPAVVLMSIVCLYADNLFNLEGHKIKREPIWYALILIGFIKETTLPFLLCFLAWKLIVVFGQAWRTKTEGRFLVQLLADYARICFSVLFPVIWYIYLRNTLITTRGFSPDFSGMFDVLIYRIIGIALIEQIGVFLVLFCAGCIVLFFENKSVVAGFFISIVVFYPIFHALDGLIYTGYSRFNLFILPPILAAAYVFIRTFLENRRVVFSVVILLVICTNLWLSPVHANGYKKPFWGNYLVDTSEHYYPYREALKWLRDKHGDEYIMFTGMHYRYNFEFYWSQLGWKPRYLSLLTIIKDENRVIVKELTAADIFAEAEVNDVDTVLYQVTECVPFQIYQKYKRNIYVPLECGMPQSQMGKYYLEKIFTNIDHTLMAYHRVP